MRSTKIRVGGTIAASIALIIPIGAAFAQDRVAAAPTIATSPQAQMRTAPASASGAAPVATRPLDDSTLSDTRGGQGFVIGNQTLKSSLSGNTIAGNYTAGAVSFSDNAFSNFSGMGNVVINTGAQASLQSAMNITVNLGN